MEGDLSSINDLHFELSCESGRFSEKRNWHREIKNFLVLPSAALVDQRNLIYESRNTSYFDNNLAHNVMSITSVKFVMPYLPASEEEVLIDVLKEGEFIGASIPQHLFQASQICKECQQPADLTILITGAWGAYRKISLCQLHWAQTVKQENLNEPEPLKTAAAQKPEPGRRKPGSVVPWPPKLKHAALILMLILTGAGTATSQTQTGQLSVTASVESSVTYTQGSDGKWVLTVANVKDSDIMFAPKLRKAEEQERIKKRTPPTVRQQRNGARTSSSKTSITKAGSQ